MSVRAAPLAGVLLGQAALFAAAVQWRQTQVIGAVLGLALCGAAAAYVLDEDTAVVADATPMSRPRRAAWRSALLVLPVAVGLSGLAALDHSDPVGNWLRLTPTVLALTALGVALAAALRRGGHVQPGDLAGAVVVAVMLFLAAANPLRWWLPILPLGELPHAGRSQLFWTAVAAIAAVATVVSVRDPAASRTMHPGRPPRLPSHVRLTAATGGLLPRPRPEEAGPTARARDCLRGEDGDRTRRAR
jgi:hypothetical protein